MWLMTKEGFIEKITGTRALLKRDAANLEKTLTKEQKYGKKWKLIPI